MAADGIVHGIVILVDDFPGNQKLPRILLAEAVGNVERKGEGIFSQRLLCGVSLWISLSSAH